MMRRAATRPPARRCRLMIGWRRARPGSDSARACELPGLEALFAEDRTPLRRPERNRGLLSAGRARGQSFNPLARNRIAHRPAGPLALAGLAPLRLVLEVLVGEELLFTGRP